MTPPLQGIRLVEFGQLIAIPHATKLMADMGAQVIRLEAHHRMETYRSGSLYRDDPSGAFWNRAANYNEQNRNKLNLTLDISHTEGLDILRELVVIADVFVENFTPRVMKNFRLEYDDLRQLRPDIIMLSSTGYGYTGPWANFGATGPATESASGLAYMTGYRDGPPMMPEIPYTDYTAAEHTLVALMLALLHRQRTGQGQFIDVSQSETASCTVPEALMDYAVNGRIQPRIGNEDPVMAPHGCYPCRGDDRWIVIAVATDDQWQSLCRVLNQPDWARDERFSDPLRRWQLRAALDQMLRQVTPQWDAQDLMNALQNQGVPAGAVLDSAGLLFNEHLLARRFYEVLPHHPSTGMPSLPYASRPWKMSVTSPVDGRAAPIMGEHNHQLLTELLGRTGANIAALEESGIVGYAPTNPRPVRPPNPESQISQGRMQRYEPDYQEKLAQAYGIPMPAQD